MLQASTRILRIDEHGMVRVLGREVVKTSRLGMAFGDLEGVGAPSVLSVPRSDILWRAGAFRGRLPA